MLLPAIGSVAERSCSQVFSAATPGMPLLYM